MSLFHVLDSHAYPGCAVLVDAAGQEGAAHIAFSDGAVAAGFYESREDGDLRLAVEAYRTGRGTAIPAKTWLLRAEGGNRWKVKRKMEP